MPTQTNLFIDELYQQLELEMLMNIGKIIGNGNGVDEDDIINWQVPVSYTHLTLPTTPYV